MMRSMLMRTGRVAAFRSAMRVPARFLSEHAMNELQEEKSILDDMERPQAPGNWTVTYTHGSGYFRMTKSEGGVDLVLDSEFKSQENDEVAFSVFLTRNGITGDFTLKYSESGLTLEGMTTYKSRETAIDLTPQAECDRDNHYEGPLIEDLVDTGLDRQVLAFLESHGVTPALGAFIHQQTKVFEQTAYMNFLEDLHNLSK